MSKLTKLHIIHPMAEQPVAAAFVGTAPTPGLTVEAALQTLKSSGGGLKKAAKLSSTNMDVFHGLEGRLFPKDMAVRVTMDVREKDMQLPHRKKLASEVQETVKAELASVFRRGKENSDATIVVRILLVSDGSSKGSRWKAGVGKAKLTLAWFLVSDKTGEVATGNQLYLTADCTPAASSELDHWEYSSAACRTLARSASHQVSHVHVLAVFMSCVEEHACCRFIIAPRPVQSLIFIRSHLFSITLNFNILKYYRRLKRKLHPRLWPGNSKKHL
jgi:hypothetical protein